jgi:hypothetical protein
LTDIRHSLPIELEGDLLSLSQAASMLEQHVKLASQEASVLMEDVQVLQSTTRESLERAQKAERAVCRLYKENQKLRDQAEHYRIERRVLVKECKLLRKENALLKQREQDER